MGKLSEIEAEKILRKACSSGMSSEDFRILFGYLHMPDVQNIALITGKSEQSVSEAVKRLEAGGWLKSISKGGAQ